MTTPRELFEVILDFEDALKRNKFPDFYKNQHRVEQVLRILKERFHDFGVKEAKSACDDDTRRQWENFWEFPKVQKFAKDYFSNRSFESSSIYARYSRLVNELFGEKIGQ